MGQPIMSLDITKDSSNALIPRRKRLPPPPPASVVELNVSKINGVASNGKTSSAKRTAAEVLLEESPLAKRYVIYLNLLQSRGQLLIDYANRLKSQTEDHVEGDQWHQRHQKVRRDNYGRVWKWRHDCDRRQRLIYS